MRFGAHTPSSRPRERGTPNLDRVTPKLDRVNAGLRTSAKFGVPHLCGSAKLTPCPNPVISGVNSRSSNGPNCWRGARSAVIRDIPHRTAPTSVICVFSSRRPDTSTTTTSATARSAWTPCASICLRCRCPRQPDVRVVCVSQSLSRAGGSAERERVVVRTRAASRPHVTRVEWRGERARAKGVLPRRRARDAVGPALLGHAELHSS
jgi:hypothetical protein